MNPQTRLNIARTIIDQLGGRMFVTVTGAKDFIAIERETGPGVTFRLPARFAKQDIRRVEITLTPMDLYRVKFFKGSKMDLAAEKDDVYAEDLIQLFEDETGLYCSL